MIEFKHLRKKYWGQDLWARGYFAVTAGDVNLEDIQRLQKQSEYDRNDNVKISEY